MSRILMFLGAGASIPFKIPGSRKIVDDIQESLKPYSDRIEIIRRRIREFGFIDDIETVISIFNFWSNPKKIISQDCAFIAEIVHSNLKDFRINHRDAKIAMRIREYVMRRCFITDPDIKSLIVELYNKLFQDLIIKYNLPNCNPQGRAPCPPINIFTTNYDNVIEEYCKKNGNNVCDGYRERIRGDYFFDPEYYEIHQSDIRLYKIHGTVTYARIKDNGLIDRVTFIPKRGNLRIGGDLAFPDLIYPGTQICLSREPQLELLYLLKKELSSANICLTVGYKFNDPHIAQIFSDVSYKKPQLKIYLVSPSASRIIANKFRDMPNFQPINKKFEEFIVEEDLDG